MNAASRLVLIPISISVLVVVLCCLLPAAHGWAADHPVILLAPGAPAERPSSPPTWADDLDHRLSTYLKKKYPSYDFTPYTEELDRLRDALSRRDRWAVKHEMGVFLKMLANRAYGLGDDAAEELRDLAQQTMPVDEFAIVYPGSMVESQFVRIGA